MGQKLVLGILLLGLFAGSLFAISGATPTLIGTQSRWAGASAAAITTQGGNISSVNVASISLTDKWTAFYGNVTGTIVLGSNTQNIFNWTFSAGSTGEVCVSTGSAVSFTSPAAAVAATIDTNWGLGASADNATNTFSIITPCPSLVFSTGTATSPIQIVHKGSSNFGTCAIYSGGAQAKATTSFCTVMSSAGKNYQNASANYEIMAPTTPGGVAETYYFYAELG